MNINKQPRNSKSISEKAFISFRKIYDFVEQLKEVCGSKFHEIVLYEYLLSKTKLSNKNAVNRHIALFSEFCSRNQDAIFNKDSNKLVFNQIKYSEKVYLDLKAIFSDPNTDTEMSSTIWTHLLVIQATIDPYSGARELLSKMTNKNDNSSEGQFLNNFMGKLESSINKEQAAANPMMAVTSILNSGFIGELMTNVNKGVQTGELDIGKLMGAMQGMLGNLTGNQTETSSPQNNIMNNIGSIGGLLSNLMNPLGNDGEKLEGLDPEKIQQQIEKEVQAELNNEKAKEINTAPEKSNLDDPN